MRDVVIMPKEEGKGRSFQAVCLASVEADLLWEGGATAGDKRRPVWAVFGGSDGDLRPFMANLRLGRTLTFPKDGGGYYNPRKAEKMEFLRSAGYEPIWQRTPDGNMVTVTLPDLVRVDPGMVDPEGVRFVMLTSREYLAAQEIPDIAKIIRHAHKAVPGLPSDLPDTIAATAMLFTAYLDRRTRCPIVADARFHLQIFAACLRDGLASWPSKGSYGSEGFGVSRDRGADVQGLDDLGIDRPVTFQSEHETIEKLLATEVDRFFTLTKGKS